MLIVWKGGSARIDITGSETIGVIFGVGAAVALLVAVFFCPWLYRVLLRGDWELKYYHIPLGPLLLWRPEPTPPPEDYQVTKDYYYGHKTMEELKAEREAHGAGAGAARLGDEENHGAHLSEKTHPVTDDSTRSDSDSGRAGQAAMAMKKKDPRNPDKFEIIGPRPQGGNFSPAVLFWQFKRVFFRGVEQDIISQQSKANLLSGDIEKTHAYVPHYDNKAEYLYSFLQVLTASAASFAHGANDVSNAIGPYTSIYHIWRTNELGSKVPVPYWILVFGGAAIVIGLWTYGYNIMRNLGNRITLHSPSRGFSMELGAAVTVIMATRLSKCLLFVVIFSFSPRLLPPSPPPPLLLLAWSFPQNVSADFLVRVQQNFPSPLHNVSPEPRSVSVSVQALGELSTGVWFSGSMAVGSLQAR